MNKCMHKHEHISVFIHRVQVSPLACNLVLDAGVAEGVGAGEAGCVVLGRSLVLSEHVAPDL